MNHVQSESNLEVELHPLLQALLAHVRRARQTPLQFGIDSEGIVAAALKDLGSSEGRSGPWEDGPIVTAALNKLVDRFLQNEPMSSVTEGRSPRLKPSTRRDSGDTNASHPLANWLDCLYTTMSDVQPRAIEILGLRVEGFQDRDIAERLGLGLRLVKHIIEDMRVHWSVAVGLSLADPG
jgi:hypothetical protein